MRTLLCAIPALLALAGTALAEPQQLDEAQLGGIAAGQDLSSGLNVSTREFNTISTATSVTDTVETNVGQSLYGGSANTTYSTGVGSNNVTAMGSANTLVTGNIR